MALLTDDCDICDAQLTVENTGNGDWYIKISDQGKILSVRVSMSGGIAPTDVKLAVAELGRAMYKHGLNEPPEFNSPAKA